MAAIQYPRKLKTADNRAFLGAQGSGKGHRMKEYLRPESRLLVWDSMQDDWNKEKCRVIVGSMGELARLVTSAPRFRVAYVPQGAGGSKEMRQEFNVFCRLAHQVGRMAVAVDEADEVTSPQYAPPAWRSLGGRARHAGLRVCAATHSPNEIDGKFLTNCRHIICGRLEEPAHIAKMSKIIGPEWGAKLQTLPDWVQIHKSRDGIELLTAKAKLPPALIVAEP